MQGKHFYEKAHLVVAAVRILSYLKQSPPSLEDVCEMLNFTLEQGNRISNRLHELNVIDIVEGGFGTRIFLQDHLKLEQIDLEKEITETRLDDELKKFKESKKGLEKQIESIREEQNQKRKDLFADIESRLKNELGKKNF